MLATVTKIPFHADPFRAAVICLCLLAFGFALAMVWSAFRERHTAEIIRSCSLSLFCLYGVMGNFSRRAQHITPRTPILALAALLAIIGFTMSRRERR